MEPKRIDIPLLDIEETEFTSLSYQCWSLFDIEEPWNDDNVDLCPPEEWLSNVDCYDVCTLCITDSGIPCSNLPRGNGGSAGKVISDHGNTKEFSSQTNSSENQINYIVQTSESIILMPHNENLSFQFVLYDRIGRMILTEGLEDRTVIISKQDLPSGIYIGVLKGEASKTFDTLNIFIP